MKASVATTEPLGSQRSYQRVNDKVNVNLDVKRSSLAVGKSNLDVFLLRRELAAAIRGVCCFRWDGDFRARLPLS